MNTSNNLNIHPPEGLPRKFFKGIGRYKMVYTINDMNQDEEKNEVKYRNDKAPQTTVDGPVVNRTIPLPALNSFSSQEKLIPKEGQHEKLNGIINPVLDIKMDAMNTDNSAWSDTSSDNMKDPSSSRASTLTRDLKDEEGIIKDQQAKLNEYSAKYNEAKEKSNSFPRYTQLGTHSEPLRDFSSSVPDKTISPSKVWDVFRVSSREPNKPIDGSYLSMVRKIVKVFVSIVLTLLIIVTAMLSKSSLLLITSNIYTNVTLKCEKTHHLGHVTHCQRVSGDEIDDHPYQPSQTVEVSWLWALFTVVCTPYLFTFFKSLWRVLFKKTRKPTFNVLLICLAIETLHTIGICIFVFYLLPQVDPIRGLMLTFGVALVPSILKIFDRQNEGGKRVYMTLFDIIAMLVQLSILLLWPLRNILKKEDYQNAWCIFVSLLLISLGWWENYVNKFTHAGKFGQTLREIKYKIRRMRTKVYMVISIWKILLTLGMMIALMSNLRFSCVKVLFYRGENRATECPHFAYPTDGYNVESWTYKTDPFWVAIIQIFSGLLCYTFCKTACKIMLQVVSFSLPLMLAAPIMVGLFIGNCETWKSVDSSNILMPDYMFWTCDIHGVSQNFLEKLISEYYLPITITWWLSFMWVTVHIWIPRVERLVQTERLFVQPLYCGIMLEQSLMLNRRRDDRDRDRSDKELRFKFEHPFNQNRADRLGGILPGRSSLKTDRTPMIYVCATMWHETQKEMIQILTSLFRLDNDQCARKNAQKFFDVVDPDYYEFEAHIFFDDAYDAHEEDDYEYSVNSFVKQLVNVMDTAASKVHKVPVRIPPPTKYPTPYGGRLEWVLPGNNKLCAHLKDKVKIRHKKRWSQVMYMYYLLGLKLVSQPLDARRKQTIADNSFILALDGDVNFKPSAVQLLVDRMKKNEKVGAACGRIHPVGTGPMVWYQKFEYAVSHWLQKATEHMIGCVLCSPGCFSLFRASALMDDNVMRKYASISNHARHYVQYDQGEDRWLCTLLLQQGYRVEYSAAADALTFAPEGFAEFFNQRRRWSPSTMANIMDLLMDWKNVIRINENISFLYIIYQGLLFLSSIVTPGTIFLLIVGALNSAFKLDLITSLMINLAPMTVFLLACFFIKGKWQILLAEFLSLFYALVMMVVVVGLGLEMKREGLCSPTTIFLIFIVGIFITAAILHPQEFYCLFHGVLYFLCIPSMSMLLMIYSICNLHVVSWGTRENAIASQPNQKPKKETKEGKGKLTMILNKLTGDHSTDDSDYAISFGNLFKCLCCPKPKTDETDKRFAEVLAKLELLEESLVKPRGTITSAMKDAETNVKDEDISVNEIQSRKEENGIRYNPIYQPKASPQEDDTPYWIHDDDIGHGKIRYLSKEEKVFWHDLIGKYLYPLQHNEKHKKKMEQDLLELRNKMSLMFFMMNALFIIIIFSLQYSNATSIGSGLSIPLPCHDTVTGESLSLEPISMLFMAIFGIALLIQFISMFFHRLATFLHIMSTTEVNCMKPNQNEVAQMDIASKVQLVKEMQRFEDDDDTRSVSTVGSDLDEDSSLTQDDSPKIKRKKTVLKLTRRKRSQAPQSGNLSGKFLRNFMEMAKDMENGGGGNSNKKRSGSSNKKRSKNAKKAMESLEQNRDAVLNKAHVIKSRWQRLVKASKWDSGGDKWGSLMRNVLGQSRTSLNTITEDDKRNSWIRGLSRMTRSNSEFSVSTLPDLGSWSVRNSYAEPILNIITDELENAKAGRPATIAENQTVVEINNSPSSSNTDDPNPSKQENLYDAVDELNSNSDSDIVSDYEESGVPKSNSGGASPGVNAVEMKTIGVGVSKVTENNGDTHL